MCVKSLELVCSVKGETAGGDNCPVCDALTCSPCTTASNPPRFISPEKRTEKRKRSLEQLQSRSASGSNDSLEPKVPVLSLLPTLSPYQGEAREVAATRPPESPR